ncbi:MAG TPA: bifunctional 4-hydroxy-2-oxoglutarate aldolase/2-dehydro-3-deoxy-phosphogluconate aldolase [Candidatus Baltobacteraceae bacterium]|jgi:2-dehydro-3-deoxyphosphogluconate aldolase/(4S)-4-hydroxy-2-oxoglutarate aldolase|nr:bifunctional 4-hydroxy-2-oxoglutarate aldolase/2-dehydro-3-deoxy-phosphogluconate aldolase [Candidatus Baltobacteraceae bacterium]
MSQQTILDRVAQFGIVPVVTIEEVDKALPLADALLAAGLPILEITFRTAAAAEIIRTLSRERPQLIVGAGTVMTPANLEAAKINGAAFGVAPGLNPQIVNQARQLGLPFVPGVATPSEIEIGISLGCKLLKFFPAEALGGGAMIDAFWAPFKHTGVRFVPSGGVTPGNLEAYLKLGSVAAVGGAWLARAEDLAAGNWSEISARARAAVDIVARARRQ